MVIPKRRKLTHDRHVLLGTLLAGLPGVLVTLGFLWLGEGESAKMQWTFSLLVLGFWLGFSFSVQNRVVRSLQTMANLLSAVREGDFSIRARGANREDAHGDVMTEINSLGSLRTRAAGGIGRQDPRPIGPRNRPRRMY